MNETQCKAAAAGFIHALKEEKTVRDQWVAIRKDNDWKRGASTASLRELIGETLGLAQTPTDKDLKTMRKHGQERLAPQLDELEQIDNRIEPNIICNGFDDDPF